MKAQRFGKTQSGTRQVARGLLPALFPGLWSALLPALCGLFFGCGDSTLLIVSIGGIDAGANQLLAQARFGETQFLATPSFSLERTAFDASGRYTFGLRVHDRTSGQLSVSVATVAASGEGETQKLCLLQTEVGSAAIVQDIQPTLSIDLPTQVLDGTACNRELPIVERATQDLVDGRTRLVVEGFGFVPGSKLLLDSDVQNFVVNASPLRLYADLPIISAPSGARPVRVEVQLPDEQLSNAVQYLASEPWFAAPTAPVYRGVSDAQGVEIYTGATAADFNGDKISDVAVAGYIYKDGQRTSGFVDIFLSTGRGLSGMQRLRSAVWNDTGVAPTSNISAEAIVATNYRLRTTRDLIVAINDNAKARGGYIVLDNDGLGHFTPSTSYVLSSNYASPSAIAHVDVNIADDAMGHPDVVLLTNSVDGSSLLNVFLSDTNGNIGTGIFWAIGIGKQVSGFSAIDVNDDGASDFAFVATGKNDPSRPQLRVVLNYHNGKLWNSFVDTQMNLTLPGFGGAVVGASLVDAGKTYLVASSYALTSDPQASVSVVSNLGLLPGMTPSDAPSSPQPPDEPALTPLPQLYSAGARPFGLAALDADHDRRIDVAASLTGDGKQPTRIVILRHREVASDSEDLFSAGPGRSDALPTWLLYEEVGDATLLAADITGDTQLDLIAMVRGDGAAGRPGALWFLRNL